MRLLNHKNAPPGLAPPTVIDGFEHVNRYWDRRNEVFAAKILPGEYYVTRAGEMIATVLGSCVSAAIRDPITRVGGMNHFMLPKTCANDSALWKDTTVSAATRYGSFAMEHLINDILKTGARRDRLEVKLFGGGKVLKAMTDVGRKNISFAHGYLRNEGLHIASEDTGDYYPRKVLFFPESGRVMVKKLRTVHNDTIAQRETRYMHEIEDKPVVGEVDLF